VPTSVVIACHTEKRWDLLLKAIHSTLDQTAPAAEVIVAVDHNPTLLDRLTDENLPITVIANTSARGASGARNTGAHAATTDVIAFLDDDAAARRTWLENLVEPLADPTVVGTGGHVLADWHGNEPRWFPAEFGWVVGATHRGAVPPDGRVRNVWAENMAIRAELFKKVGGFRIGFGKLGNHSRPEDTDLCIRMAAEGRGHWRYAADAVVTHHVPPDRSDFGFFTRRCYHEGRGKAELADLLEVPGEALSAERDYTFKVLPQGVLRGLAHPANGGAAKSGAIVVGFSATLVGYLVGVGAARRRRDRRAHVAPPLSSNHPENRPDKHETRPA